MANVGGKKREQKEFVKKVGVFEAEVVAINPTAEDYAELTGETPKEDSKMFEYLGEKEGVKSVRITVHLKEKKEGTLFNVSFFIENKIRENKEDAETRKEQWINNLGSTTWMEKGKKATDLPDWFAKDREVRKALSGEEEMYNFLRSWLQIDFFDPEASLEFEATKLLKGVVRDLQGMIDSDYATITPKVGKPYPATIVALAAIKTKEIDGETKEMQVVNNRNFLPGYTIRSFENKRYTRKEAAEWMNVLKTGTKEQKKAIKNHQRFIAAVMDNEHGVKEFFGPFLTTLKDYNPSENVAASSEVVTIDEGDSEFN